MQSAADCLLLVAGAKGRVTDEQRDAMYVIVDAAAQQLPLAVTPTPDDHEQYAFVKKLGQVQAS